ncbi:MAG: hypothetical protein KAX31_03585 [Thermoplasmata archaeon]|nr:hypothetical protein [Thermoplasmata archaeon]
MKRMGEIMKIEDIAELLEAKIDYMPEEFDTDIVNAGACDLMSDVLAYVAQDILLITGLLSPQVIRTANLMDISAVVFTRGKIPTQYIIDEARKSNIAVLSTSLKTFSTCGLLYQAGLRYIEDDTNSSEDHDAR